MIIADGRTGAYGMTFKREPLANDLPSVLLEDLKSAVYINDNSFDNKLIGLLTDAIFDFERIAAYSILPQSITLNYEYFLGKNRLPFAPISAILSINGIAVESGEPLPTGFEYSNGYLTAENSGTITIFYRAGADTIPENIKRVLIKMAEAKFKNEVSAMDYPFSIYSQIRSFTNWID